MSQTKNAAELCALLVEETYGELTYRIFTLLLRRGRLSIPALAQYTRLPPRHIRHGLAVLVQQNLVYYHTEHDREITYYEANHDAAYFLLRSGKIIEYVQSRYGSPAQIIVQNLLFLGHAKIDDLLKACRSTLQSNEVHANIDGKGKPLANGLQNGFSKHAEDSVSKKLLEVLGQLLESGLVTPVFRTMLQSPSDVYGQVEKEVLHAHFKAAGIKGNKQKEELKAMIAEKLRDIRSESELWQCKGAKRALNGAHINGGEKRRKLANGVGFVDSGSHASDSEGDSLNRDLVVRINYEKCTVALRNQQLVSLAAHQIGETTSHVYATFLNLLQDRIPRCQLDPTIDDLGDISEGPTVSTVELAQALSKSIDLSVGIGKVDSNSVDARALDKAQKKRKRIFDNAEAAVERDASSDEKDDQAAFDHVNGHSYISEGDQDSDNHGEYPSTNPFKISRDVMPPGRTTKVTFDDQLPKMASRDYRTNRMGNIKNHLLLLVDRSPHFVRKCGSRDLGEWTVDFERVVKHMQEAAIDSIIHQNFGTLGVRIAQILRLNGKLDEKQIQKLGLLKLKDVRTKLVEMQMSGFADIQEIPRDHTRSAVRTMFLWFFDPHRAKMITLEQIYKTISRCLQVLKAEKHAERDVLSQAERTDVKGQEAEMLTTDRLEKLHRIRDKEKKVFTQIGRLDELVAIFKDF